VLGFESFHELESDILDVCDLFGGFYDETFWRIRCLFLRMGFLLLVGFPYFFDFVVPVKTDVTFFQ